MTVFLRFITILRVFLRYRLDELIPHEHLPLRARLLLLPCKLFAKSPLSRGERLRRACEQLGPIFVKFGQLLSTRPDFCLLYTSPSPRDRQKSRMPSSA